MNSKREKKDSSQDKEKGRRMQSFSLQNQASVWNIKSTLSWQSMHAWNKSTTSLDFNISQWSRFPQATSEQKIALGLIPVDKGQKKKKKEKKKEESKRNPWSRSLGW